MLTWNRPVRDDGNPVPEQSYAGGDRQWSDVRACNYRAELSVAFSDDDGATWSKPVVVAQRLDPPGASLAYAYVFEHQPGAIWITTMQGEVRIGFKEDELRQP